MPRTFHRNSRATPFEAKVRHFHRGATGGEGEKFRLWEWRDVRGILGGFLTTAVMAGLVAAALYFWWRSTRAEPDKAPDGPPPPVSAPAVAPTAEP